MEDVRVVYRKLVNARTRWDKVWRDISKYILPSRGIFYTSTKKPNRELVHKDALNKTAKQALNVLAAGIHSGMSSPVRPWFRLLPRNMPDEPVAGYIREVMAINEQIMYEYLRDSAFYEQIHTFYLEYGGFCTAAMYVGWEDGKLDFQTLTAGEYAYSPDSVGRPNIFIRKFWLTIAQLIQKFGKEKLPKKILEQAEKNPTRSVGLLHAVFRERNGKFKYKSQYLLEDYHEDTDGILDESGYYEMPYFTARWETLSGDVWGVGPGFDSINDVKRLQDMERTISMAAHKAVDPPVNVPARRKGQINLLPGGQNYYTRPDEVVTPVYAVKPEIQGALLVLERVELRVQKAFYNDVFLTAVRNPNASPLKATEVNERSEERLIRLGPVIERLEHEFLGPLLRRVYNLLEENGKLVDYEKETGQKVDVGVDFISVLAQAQKLVAAGAIQNFLAFVAGAAQFEPGTLDVIDSDNVVYEYADITGVPETILRSPQEVEKIRKQRAMAQQQQQQAQAQMLMQQFQAEMEKLRSEIAKNYAQAGKQTTAALGEANPQLPGMVPVGGLTNVG